MKKLTLLLISFLFSMILVISCTQAQALGTVGKLFTKDQANQLFGPVVSSQTISAAALRALAERSPNYIMFNLINGRLVVLNANRKVLSGPASMTAVSPTQVFHFCSASKILELLQTSGATSVKVEQRQNNLTITADSQTLEDFMTCPPTCAQ